MLQTPTGLGLPLPEIDWPPFLEILEPPPNLRLPFPDIRDTLFESVLANLDTPGHSIHIRLPSPEVSQSPIDSELHVPEISQGPLGLSSPSRSSPLIDLELPFCDKNVIRIVAYGPCTGIFCLYGTYLNSPSQLIFWNPATREVKVLPLPHRPPTDRDICIHGFGIDPKTNDYKVVSILTVAEDILDLLSMRAIEMPKVEVYNLSSNSWKMINANVPTFQLAGPIFSSCLNGIYHWLSTNLDYQAILCFDMSSEVFWEMKLPSDIEGSTYEHCTYSNVAVINGSIAYVREYSCCNMLGSQIVIWVMDEYGVEETWTKRFTIGPHPGLLKFRGFWEDGEILASERENGPLFSINLDTQRSVQEFPVEVGPRLFQAFRYVESMVPISVLGVE